MRLVLIIEVTYVSKRHAAVEDGLEDQRVEDDEQEILAHRANFLRGLAVRTFKFGQRTHEGGQEGQEDVDKQDGNVVDDQVGRDGANIQNPTKVRRTGVGQTKDNDVAEEGDNGGPKQGDEHDEDVDAHGGDALQPTRGVEVVPMDCSGRHRDNLGVPVPQLDRLLYFTAAMLS